MIESNFLLRNATKPLFVGTPLTRRGDRNTDIEEVRVRIQKAETALRMCDAVVSMRNLAGFSTFLMGIDELREQSMKLLILETMPAEKSRLQGKVMALDAIIGILVKHEEAQKAHAKDLSELQKLLESMVNSKGPVF